MYDKFLIAPIDEGLRLDLKAWQIPDSAYAQLDNAYIFRGRLKKRIGSKYSGADQLTSRLRVYLGTTDSHGVLTKTGYTDPIYKVGQQFSLGTEIFTITTLGTSATSIKTGTGTLLLNTTSGDLTITDALYPGTPAYYYPCEPVMGLCQYEAGTVHNQVAYAFDTRFAYHFTGSSWLKDDTILLTGGNADFVWATNWIGVDASETILFCTNNKDSMFYYNGSTVPPAWTLGWQPKFLDTGTSSQNCITKVKIILPFKGILLLMGVEETNGSGTKISYPSRIRHSHQGNPTNADAFKQPGQLTWLGGSYIDGPTQEEIMGAELIRDRCIVYFERSTWELAYTGNAEVPFMWQQVNTELGSESQFSTVPFDKFILNFGPNGIQSCNGINVDRIDDKIPSTVFNLRVVNDGFKRIAGVRDYYTEMAYWTVPTDDAPYALLYPNKMIVFNYKNGTWAQNDDCITCFGYFEQESNRTWLDMTQPWTSYVEPWSSNVTAANFRSIIAGNQHGFVTILSTDLASNAANLLVNTVVYDAATETVTLGIKDHSLNYSGVNGKGDFVALSNMNGTTLSPLVGSGIYKISNILNTYEIVLGGFKTDPGTYLGGGLAARVSRIDILSKQWNPYKDKNRGVYLGKIDFGVLNNPGAITVDYAPSYTSLSMLGSISTSNPLLGSNELSTQPYALSPLEKQQEILWHPLYFCGEGESVQIRMYYSDTQMLDATISQSDFELQGLVLYTQATRIN